MTFLKNNAVQFVAAAFLFTTYAQAAVVLELDAAALPEGEVSETQNAIPGGRWQPNVALRVERVVLRGKRGVDAVAERLAIHAERKHGAGCRVAEYPQRAGG